MSEDLTRGPYADQSGWVTTKVAARTLRVDPRTVRKYIKQGKLIAKSEGEGVEKTYLVSVDSLHKLRGTRPDPRITRDEIPPESAAAATSADLVDLVRDLSGEVTRRASEAAELRTRLELTEQAESSRREALEQRLETERIRREQAEHERDRLVAELEALREARESPVTASESPTASREQWIQGHEGETYGTSAEEAEDSLQGDSLQRRSSWWRRFFGFE